MKKLLPFAAAFLLLSACTKGPANVTATDVHTDQMRNPLVTEEYWSELTQTMVDLQTHEKDDLKKAGLTAYVDSVRQESLKMSGEAHADRKNGLLGRFIPMKQNVTGYVLVRPEGVIFFGPDFQSEPGPSLHLILTEAVDPRDAAFPDAGSLDLGEVQSPFGPQIMNFDKAAWKKGFRTLALYDTKLHRLYAFAQLSAQM